MHFSGFLADYTIVVVIRRNCSLLHSRGQFNAWGQIKTADRADIWKAESNTLICSFDLVLLD